MRRGPPWLTSAFQSGRERDLIEIYDYTEETFGAYQADAYHAGLERTFDLLASFPRIGRAVEEIAPGFRRFLFQAHTVFYTEEAGFEYRAYGKICAKPHGEPETQAARLAGKPCRPLGPNVKIIADGRARYPDAIVVCRPVSSAATVADDPVVVFAVLSEGSSQTDLIDKNREYRATPSIQRYVVLQQTHKAAIVFARRQDGWLSEIVSGDDAELDLPEIGIAVPLHEVYANTGLSDVPQGGMAA